MDFKRLQSSAVFLVVIYLLTTDKSLANPAAGFTPILRYPGDVDVLALLHFRETFTSDFRCTGSYNPRIPYDVEALRFAINRTNDALEGYTIGLTIVDPCGSPAVAVRDVVQVLSNSSDELPPTGPTIGILVPGVGEVTRAILERVTRVLDIPTIGYLPTEDRFLRDNGMEAEMLVSGSSGVITIFRGDQGTVDRNSDSSTTKPTTANGGPETQSQSTNVQEVSTSTPQPSSSAAGSNPSTETQTPADVFTTMQTFVTYSTGDGESEISSLNATMQTGFATNTTSRSDTISEGISTSMGEESEDNQQEGADDDNTMETIFLLTSAVSLDSDASVITEVLVRASWYNVGVIYSGYGTGPFRRNAFIKNAEIEGICVSFQESIPRGLTQEMSDRIIRNIANSSDSVEVLVWIVSVRELQLLLRSIRLVPSTFRGVGVFSGVNDNLEDFFQTEDENSIFLDDLQFDNNADYVDYIERLISGESEFNEWMNFTRNEGSGSMVAIEAAHTSSLIRAIEMIACGFSDVLNQTKKTEGGFNISTTDIRRAIMNRCDSTDITKLYGVYLVQSSSTVEIANVSGNSPVLNLDVYELPDAYRADGCICLASGLTLAEPDENRWTHGFSDPWIPAIFCFSLVFGLLAFVLFFLFLYVAQRPVMKKTTLLANLFLLVGIMLMYFINLFFTRVPSVLSCGFRQFGTAFIYAWVFSALLVRSMAVLKNLRPRRDYDTTNEPRRNELNNFVQFCAFCAFLAPQIALSAQWIAFESPAVVSDPEVCGSLECEVSNLSISISMIYVFILVLLTFVLSLCRLGDSSLMNESRSLFLSSLSTMFLLAGWIVAFNVADPIYHVPAICVGVTANATVILLASFGPACCVITYGKGVKAEDDEDLNGDIAYVNPALEPTSEYVDGGDVRTTL
ncbi:Metabotropic glutamate receptor 3 [Holothuria leucospilota]|uniref:Metabotropic glutamate receptor 3 n=1 Tax=Holothuria leucospilota TaxID=206669 RepID=A0A9Q1CCJ6_HOLLE|nr:Metabotropic glutamate receptor 3 [Holothuria leucospilota]